MKNINQNAPVKCSRTIIIKADSKKVWEVLTSIDQWASWQTDITKTTLKGALAPQTKFVWKIGGVKIHSTLHTVVPYQQFGWTGNTFGLFAIHNWTLIKKEEFTIVNVDESMEGLLASLFKNSFNRSLVKGMEKWLELLKQECEK